MVCFFASLVLDSSTTVYHYHVSDERGDPEVFQDHNCPHTAYFDVHFNVHFALRSSTDSPSRLTQIFMPSQHSSQFISCKQFFQNGPALLQRNLSHPMLPSEVLDQLIPKIMSNAQQIFDTTPRSDIEKGSFILYPLALEVVVALPETEQAMFDRVIGESLQEEVRMVPASKEAIQSLNKVKLEDNVVDTNQCCICQEEFVDGSMEVSVMPCHHVYHHDCIVKWLKTSHFCPLCRYSMSVPIDS